jgi:hypothetical protein
MGKTITFRYDFAYRTDIYVTFSLRLLPCAGPCRQAVLCKRPSSGLSKTPPGAWLSSSDPTLKPPLLYDCSVHRFPIRSPRYSGNGAIEFQWSRHSSRLVSLGSCYAYVRLTASPVFARLPTTTIVTGKHIAESMVPPTRPGEPEVRAACVVIPASWCR